MSRAHLGTRKTLAGALAAWLLLGFVATQPQPNEAVVGVWSGTVETPGTPLEVAVTFTAQEALAGTIDIPA